MRPAVPAESLRRRATRGLAAVAAVTAVAALASRDQAPPRPGPAAPAPQATPWPPSLEVAPPPPDALRNWATLEVTALDPSGRAVPDASVQVWADGRDCVFHPFPRAFMRPDPIDSPDGSEVWLSAAAQTDGRGVAVIRVPPGTATHIVALDRSGRQAVLSTRDWFPSACWHPCYRGDSCDTCTELPCVRRREQYARDCHNAVTIDLVEPTHISGIVRGPTGRPIAGARVVAQDTVDDWTLDHAQVMRGRFHQSPDTPAVLTDEHGRYRIDVRGRGTPFFLVAAASRFEVSDPVLLAREPRAELPVDVRLRPAGRVVMRVVDSLGPVAGAAGFLKDGEEWLEGSFSDADGWLIFDGVAPGNHEAAVRRGGRGAQRIVSTEATPALMRLEAWNQVEVQVTASPRLVATLGGRPAIHVALGEGWTDGATTTLGPGGIGFAVFQRLEPGDHTVWLGSSGILARGPVVRVGPTPVAVTAALVGNAWLSGRVSCRHHRTGHDVCLQPEDGPMACAVPDGDRGYAFPILSSGRYRIHVGLDPPRQIEIRPGANQLDLAVSSPHDDDD